jgi:hypothetical protein
MIKNKVTAHSPIRDVQRWWVPRPDAAESLERDLGGVPRRGIGHPREDDVWPEIGVGEALEDLGAPPSVTSGHHPRSRARCRTRQDIRAIPTRSWWLTGSTARCGDRGGGSWASAGPAMWRRRSHHDRADPSAAAAGQVILNTKGVRRQHWSRRPHDHLRCKPSSLSNCASIAKTLINKPRSWSRRRRKGTL